MNIFHNFIPNKIINFNKWTPWMTDDIKPRLRERCKMKEKYYKYGKMITFRSVAREN